MTVIAWNMAGLPEAERWKHIAPDVADRLGETAMAVLKDMIARKLELFPEETRRVLDYQCIDAGDAFRLNVVYDVMPEEVPEEELNKIRPDPN
jgi:hypothetical protein